MPQCDARRFIDKTPHGLRAMLAKSPPWPHHKLQVASVIVTVFGLLEQRMANVVQIRIYADPTNPQPTGSLPDVPWYAGITVLQAMIIGEAMNATNFSFRVEYRSIYGAQIDSIDTVTDNAAANLYWLLWVNGKESAVGASEAILFEDLTNQTALVEWRYKDVATLQHASLAAKTAAL
jgi:hypothetical protein